MEAATIPEQRSRSNAGKRARARHFESAKRYERAPGEGEERWEAFALYRDMGSGRRSLRAAAEQLGKSADLLERWSTQDRWVDRAAAWDAELDRVDREARVRQVEEAVARHAEHARELSEVLIAVVRNLGERVEEARAEGRDPFEGMSIEARLQAATRLGSALGKSALTERLALGLSTTNVGGHDGGALDVKLDGGFDPERATRRELDAFLAGADAEGKRREAETAEP